MSRKRKLAEVADPMGRADVALYRAAEYAMRRLENEQGLLGLRENLLPVIENLIAQNIPAENLIPQEIQAVLKICQLNKGKA